jgi:NTE family protein
MKSGGEMRTDLLIGSTNSFRSEMFLPFGRSKKWFTSITALASNSPMDIYFRGDKVSEYRVIESTGGVSAGYTLNRATQLSAGYQLGWMKYSGDVGVPVLPEGLKGWQEIATLRFAHDHRDDAIVPMRGFSAQAAFNYYRRRPLAGEGFPSIELRLSGYRPLGPKQSIYAKAASGSTFGFNDTGLPVFTLGGPSRMAAYGSNEAFMNQYAYARSGYLRQIMSLPPMAGKGVYLDAAVELAKTWHTPTISRVPVDFRVGVIAHTMLGPLEIGAAVGDSGHRKFFFQFGRTF